MTLQDQIKDETTAAMRSGDAFTRDTLRLASNALYNAEKAQRRTLTDDEALAVLARQVKQRRESIDAYRGGGREDLAAKEEAEIAVLSRFMPAPLTDEEIGALVDEAIAATGASSARDMGKVMGWLSPKIRGRADGKVVSGLVAQALARSDLVSHDAASTGASGPAAAGKD